MVRLQLRHLVLFSLLLSGCAEQHVITTWKAPRASPLSYDKIMIAGIIKEKNNSLRSEVEKEMVAKLSDIGYYAVSSIKEFGPNRFSKLGEEATYKELCDNGIDAVLTLALVDKPTRIALEKSTERKSINTYYYGKIWNYRKFQSDTSNDESNPKQSLTWECILFDLASLEPQCELRAESFDINDGGSTARLVEQIIIKMLKERVIEKKSHIISPKAF